MIIKTLEDENFANYKLPSMFIGFPKCTFKCEKECGERVCQNSTLATAPNKVTSVKLLCERYLNNPITSAVVCGGLEPMDSFDDLIFLLSYLRDGCGCDDDVVIYTGYTEEECESKGYIEEIRKFRNIIIKFGRFIPHQGKHYDEVLGVELASDNQYAKRIS